MIITPNDIRKVRPIANNIEDIARIEPYIDNAEKLDILPEIGASLYKQFDEAVKLNVFQIKGGINIITNSSKEILLTSSQWDEFLNGAYYNCDDCGCDGLRHSEGLIAATAYLAYSRLLPNHPVNVTAFGIVKKLGPLSEPIDEKTLYTAANSAKKIGLEFLRQTVDHLRCKGFIDECRKIDNKRYRKFKVIGK